MLDENDVVAAVFAYLKKSGYLIEQSLSTTEHGVDIIAKSRSKGETLRIEAKGGTSSRRGSARYNRPYTASQVFDRVAKGLYTAVALRDGPATNNRAVGVAFPDTEQFKRLLTPISAALEELRIRVYLVSEERQVRLL